MEKWQIDYIKHQLPTLISLTICNAFVTSKLIAANLISDYDEQDLQNNYPVPMERSKRLYEILFTRKDSYLALMTALGHAKQTGALEILRTGLLIEVMRELKVSISCMAELKQNINVLLDDNETLLHKAAKAHQVQQMHYLKLLQANLDARNASGETPLLAIVHSQENFKETLMWFTKTPVDRHAVNLEGHNLLMLAILYQHPLNNVQKIVNYGVDLNAKNNCGQTVLHLAAEKGNLEALKYLKALGGDFNERDNCGNTPLLQITLAENNFKAMLSWFVQQQVDVNVVNNLKANLILLAAQHGRSKGKIEELILLGIDWKAKTTENRSVIHLAAEGANLDALDLFFSLGSDLNAIDDYGNTPFLRLCDAKENFVKALLWFEDKYIDANATNNDGDNLTLLSVRSKFRSNLDLENIVHYGVNWNIKNKSGQTVMHKSAEAGNIEALEYFKSLGADLNSMEDNESTPFLFISKADENFSNLFSWFVAKGVDIHTVDNKGNNVMLLSALYGRSRIQLMQIVDGGVNWKIKNNFDGTVMHAAAAGGNIEALEYFKYLGADLTSRQRNGRTPFLCISEANKTFAETFLWFAKEGVDIQKTDYNGDNLVFLSAYHGRSQIQLKHIVDGGVNWTITNNDDETVLHLAAAGGNIEALEYLRSLGADLTAKNSFGQTPFLCLSQVDKGFAETFSWFVEQGVSIQEVDNNGNNLALLSAYDKTSSNQLKQIVDSGVNWNIKNIAGKTVMHLATKGGNTEALKFFHSIGADFTSRDNSGKTPFLYVSEESEKFIEITSWFISQGVETCINQVNPQKEVCVGKISPGMNKDTTKPKRKKQPKIATKAHSVFGQNLIYIL